MCLVDDVVEELTIFEKVGVVHVVMEILPENAHIAGKHEGP